MTDTKTTPEEKPEAQKPGADKKLPPEIGGQKGPEPTRYGDWEKKRPLHGFLNQGNSI